VVRDNSCVPQFALELADGGAERRWSHVQPLRRSPEVELLGYGDEVAQMAMLDHRDDRNRAIARDENDRECDRMRVGGGPAGVQAAPSAMSLAAGNRSMAKTRVERRV
jgi:hypothetical protein